VTEELDLYEHVKRPEWGLSMIVLLDNDRMTFGFVDGAQRTLKRESFHMMKRVVLVGDAAEEARRKLNVHAKAKAKAKGPAKAKPKKAAAVKAAR
jgi:acyl transferase domain-containing protein